uniref:Uncharacterized protein n=1 Tax=Opuntia streptacantha TaxID=393608 RepID=A0A7C8YGH2_OPUST
MSGNFPMRQPPPPLTWTLICMHVIPRAPWPHRSICSHKFSFSLKIFLKKRKTLLKIIKRHMIIPNSLCFYLFYFSYLHSFIHYHMTWFELFERNLKPFSFIFCAN